ncbi:MAG: fibrobacter succinogenes major paralogous domain-containing protein [Bacteroidales bacterium]|nr:fibrobacter succinogenes major paralogous domain-containing protein [Bacteroidales bacterium]
MKKLILFAALLTVFIAAVAQTPKISYQAVLRDADNHIVSNTTIAVDITITYGTSKYSETGLTATTNENGLFSLEIGNVSGYEAIKWENATIKAVVSFGANTIEHTSAVTAVPYALKANFATGVDTNGTTVASLYSKIRYDSAATDSTLKDTAAAIRNDIPAAQVNADWESIGGMSEILNKPAINDGTLTIILPDSTVKTITANQEGNTDVNIKFMSVQDFLDVLAQMTPEQIAALRDSLGISEPDTTSCGTMVDADGNNYQTVVIGSQCWSKSNLRTTHYRNGGAIPMNQDISLNTASYYCPTQDDTVTKHYPDSIYGIYYNGYVVDGDTLCPAGWHVPSISEWEVLADFAGNHNSCGGNPDYNAKALADTCRYFDQNMSAIIYAWAHNSKNCAVGSDRGYGNFTGFSAFPAGYWENTFNGYSLTASFWSSTPDNDKTWVFYLSYSQEMGATYKGDKDNAISVRCLKDTP